MNFKKKILIVLLILSAVILCASLLYKFSIRKNLELSLTNNNTLNTQYNRNYNEFISSAKKYFSDINKSYKKKPYYLDDKNSYIKELYDITDISLHSTYSEKYPLRVDIRYDYVKTIFYKNNTEKEVETNNNFILLYNKNTNDWETATISVWFIPFIFIFSIIVLSILYNFVIKPKLKKIKTE